MGKALNIYRWEHNYQVVEIVAETIEQASNLALSNLYPDECALVIDRKPTSIKQATDKVEDVDRVNTWLKH
jgi:hypothetical protein